MPDAHNHSESIRAGSNLPFGTDEDAFAVCSSPYRQSRITMLITSVLLGLGALTFLVLFGYQLYRFLTTGGAYAPTTVPWPVVLGHFLRAVGLGLLCGQLAKLALNIDRGTGGLSSDFAVCHRRLWQTVPCVLAVLAAFAVFEAVYTSNRDLYGFFRPEFESGFVLLEPNRIQFRRASEAPVKDWLKEKVRHTGREFYVSPKPEISGIDIRQAMLRIAEIFPGTQTVEVHIQFTEEGGKKMERLTKSHLTKPLAVFLDGKLRSTPRIFSPISERAQITNVLEVEEAARLIHEKR